MAKNATTLQAKLVKVFLIQVLLISVVTLAGIYAAKIMVQDVLVHEALKGEAEHFWENRAADPNFPLPDTLNLHAYIVSNDDVSSLPAPLRALGKGFQRAELDEQTPLVYVEQKGPQRLYLVFDEVKVSRLALLFGILPLAGVLVVLYLLAWVAYRQSHRAVSPIVKLARAVGQAKIREGKLPNLDLEELRQIPDEEVSSLVQALDEYTQRLDSFIDRERLFTRDASHELRTPIAVLRSAMELIERRYSAEGDKTMSRVYRTLYDMEALIETLLVLAREERGSLPLNEVHINRLAKEQLDTLSLLFKDKQIEAYVEQKTDLIVNAPERVLYILISNLIRNAFNYTTQGTITVNVWSQGFSVKDSGVGMDKEQIKEVFNAFYRAKDREIKSPGYGLGLTIVKRLCDRYDWHVRIHSELGKGTEVRVNFPKTQIVKS
ncbi:hypothetical protein LCGC14_0924200 [marine sediment metagenome]|uniref:histidine kinase n=2 Tax=root TaxID=1 RepID=A0A0F9NPX3_9ZZZZ